MLASKFPCQDSLLTCLSNILHFNKQKYNFVYLKYTVFKCQAVFPGHDWPKCNTGAVWWATGWWRAIPRQPAWEGCPGTVCLGAWSWVHVPAVQGLQAPNCSWKPSLWCSCCCLRTYLWSPSPFQGKDLCYDLRTWVLELYHCHSVEYVMLSAFFGLLLEFFFFVWRERAANLNPRTLPLP